MKQAPPDGESSSQIFSPCASTKAFAMARPSPALPPGVATAEHLEQALAVGRRYAGALVLDSHADRMGICVTARTVTGVPSGAKRAAFSSRLASV